MFFLLRVLEGSAFLTGGYNCESSDIENKKKMFIFILLTNQLKNLSQK